MSRSDWNFNIDAAPRTGRIIVAAEDGTVTISQWLQKASRWEMLAKNEQPIAWMPWPEHPKAVAAESQKVGE